MERTKLGLRFLILLPLLLALYTSVCEARILAVPAFKQETSNWCWAATSQAILSYYGINALENGRFISQCEIANWARAQNGWGNDDCCSNPGGSICNQVNNISNNPGSIRSILAHWGISSYLWGLNVSEVIAQFDSYKPIIMNWNYPGYGGHFLVGYGYLNGLLYYIDPLGGSNTENGYAAADYDWAKGGTGQDHRWIETLVINQENQWAITKGLNWLIDHQNPNGSWSYLRFGVENVESVELTSMAALAFLNYGIKESHPAVKKAITYILSNRNPDGSITNYSVRADKRGESLDTSFAILALVATRNLQNYDAIKSAVGYVISTQYDEDWAFILSPVRVILIMEGGVRPTQISLFPTLSICTIFHF